MELMNMLRRSNFLFNRVSIIGVGLMGGSLGMAIKKNGIAREVIGLSSQQSSLVEAIKVGAIDTASTDFKSAVSNADLVVLATPVDDIIKLLTAINPHIRRGCVITDVGSTKVAVIESAQKILSHPENFIGSHPMVGSEKKGVINARADLFENALCILTPTKNNSHSTQERMKQFWTKVGAKIKNLTPEEHDECVGYISHLPHLMAFGLMESVPDKYLEYAASGLKDTTRIAGSSPQMWKDICMTNSKNVIKALDEMVVGLSNLRKAIIARDDKELLNHFSKANQKRGSLS